LSVAKPQTLSLVETISAGYAAVNRRLWVLVIPIALDLYLWLGTRLSFAPFLRLLRDSIVSFATLLEGTPQQQEQLVVWLLNADIRSWLALLYFVPAFMPQLMPGVPTSDDAGVIYASNPPEVLAALLVANLLALLVSSVFLSLLAASVRRKQHSLTGWAKSLLVTIGGIGGYLLLFLGAGAALSVPFVVLLFGTVWLVPALAPWVLFLWFVAWFWGYVYTGFAIEAVLIYGVGPLRAIIHSITIVRRHFTATLGLLVLSVIIVAGLGVLWRTLVFNLPGLLLALVAHAYIGSGLVAARLVFVHNRLESLNQPQSSSESQ
jgi:hypothetical protein